jgi:hypothetical protein
VRTAPLGFLVLAMGCAHAPAAPARPHAALYLASIEGLSEDQNRVIETTLCAGLNEGNGSDVTCPDSIRAALSLQAQRTQITGQVPEGQVDPVAEANKIDQIVSFKAEAANGGFDGHLSLQSKASGKELAHRDYHAASWDELMVKAEPEAKALVQ